MAEEAIPVPPVNIRFATALTVADEGMTSWIIQSQVIAEAREIVYIAHDPVVEVVIVPISTPLAVTL